MHPKTVETYREMGYELDFDYYQNVDEEKLRKYPLVVGMIPIFSPGTRAIDDDLGKAIENYVGDGGGFLFLPGPSYYGQVDFMHQLNPWLSGLGAELINDQPRDPRNQKVLNRVVDYRYLRASALKKHPVTKGIEEIWLPIDYHDGFLRTHTMKISPEWDVLVRGGETCASYVFNDMKTVGAYTSAPPFLATRNLGKGRMALFTTASRYYFFDAHHWAHGDGFVMERGGRRLMSNLFSYLSAGSDRLFAANTKSPGEKAPADVETCAATPAVARGNVPVMDEKREWIGYVLDTFRPKGFGVSGYVDSGSLFDLPYSKERGYGYLGGAWTVKWAWSEYFHATASNGKAFDNGSLKYRFDGIDKSKSYKVGVLAWGYQKEGSRFIEVAAGNRESLGVISVPSFVNHEGPVFEVLDVPVENLGDEGRLELSFSRAEGGMGHFASVCEVWLFESGARERETPRAVLARFEPPDELAGEPIEELPVQRGLIGARSSYSDPGNSSVGELCATAKEAGFTFLVFTEEARKLTQDRFAAFKKECEASTDDSFAAIPGLRFSSRYKREPVYRGDRPHSWGDVTAYAFQNIEKLPDEADYDDPYALYWRFLGGEVCGGASGPPTLTTPGTNGITPYYQRFWRGFDVITYGDDGRIIDDSRDLYVDLLSDGYGPYPRVSGVYRTPDDIRRARNGWFVTLTARRPLDVVLWNYATSISSGPIIKKFAFSFDHSAPQGNGGGILFKNSAWINLDCSIESPSPLKRVTLFSQHKPIRTWHPHGNTFSVNEPILIARHHHFWMLAETEDGREAISGNFLTQENSFFLSMCGDNQNSICNLRSSPEGFRWDDREMFLGHHFWHTGEGGGALGAMRDVRELVPRVIEAGIIQPLKAFRPVPRVYFADGHNEWHYFSELKIERAAKDSNRVRYVSEIPDGRTRSDVSITAFRSVKDGATAALVETEIEARTNITLRAEPFGVEHVSLGLISQLARSWNYTIMTATNGLVSAPFDYETPDWLVEETVDGDGAILLWPNAIGNMLVVPLDGNDYNVRIVAPIGGGIREMVTLNTSPKELKTGEKIRGRILVALHQGEVKSAADLADIRRQYVQWAESRLRVESGVVEDSTYPVRVAAENHAVSGEIDLGGISNPLPLLVTGVNLNWPAGKIVGGKLTLVEPADDELAAVFDSGSGQEAFFVGNLLLCDQPDLRLEWGGVQGDGIRFHAHNPRPTPIEFTVKSHPQLGELPGFSGTWSLQPGESAWFIGGGGTVKSYMKKNKRRVDSPRRHEDTEKRFKKSTENRNFPQIF